MRIVLNWQWESFSSLGQPEPGAWPASPPTVRVSFSVSRVSRHSAAEPGYLGRQPGGVSWSGSGLAARLGDASIAADLTGRTLAGFLSVHWSSWRVARKNSRSLWKKVRGYVGAAVNPLTGSPVRDQFPPELDRTLAAMGSVEGQEILPVRGFHAGTFDRPPQVS
jgi:hypothetical protein